MAQFRFWNGPMPTSACQLALATGTTIKTHLQVKPLSTCRLIGWGVSMDASAAAAGVQVEILETGTIFGTVTAYVEADVVKVRDTTDLAATSFTLSTSASGYNASAEGTIVSTRVLDSFFNQPTNAYAYQFPYGREPRLLIASAYRIRSKAALGVNALAYMDIEV